jgi:hypothetical protein
MRNDSLFSGLEPPPPPSGLREAALRAGRAAFDGQPRADLWVRLAASPVARLAWAASVVLLAAANALLPAAPSPEVPTPVVLRPEPEIAAIARLPRIDERALSARQGDRS